jgi:N-hydroxyarylamine O-acetyltransferase
MPDAQTLDLAAYLARIEYDGPLEVGLETLRALHFQHATRVPFENLDIQLGKPIKLDLETLQRKIVGRRRGGYCFEQNTLFAAVLRRVGFRVTTLSARVRYMATAITPRTHMLLRVDLAEGAFIADVGFGGHGLLEPLRLAPGEEQAQHLDTYRMIDERTQYGLEARLDGKFAPLYAFTLEESHPIDYELANYFTSTHPSSRFVQMLVASKATRDARHTLRNREYTLRRGDAIERRVLERDADLFATLDREFGLSVEPGSKFRALESAPTR